MEVQTTDASHLGVVASGGDGQGRHNCLKNLQFVSLFVLARSVREVVETKAGDLRSLLCEGCTTAMVVLLLRRALINETKKGIKRKKGIWLALPKQT
uniref:Uncharacterized protein n=1 Tax=Oryza sativa subsp. japonica TaxID=39947 RepID=Q84YK2_ORYSJ|nr:hypothetical protein [Oryza sativa Japonica Group]